MKARGSEESEGRNVLVYCKARCPRHHKDEIYVMGTYEREDDPA